MTSYQTTLTCPIGLAKIHHSLLLFNAIVTRIMTYAERIFADIHTGVFSIPTDLDKIWISDSHKSIFTARCTLVQSAVLRSHVVCPSVCLSVTLRYCDYIGWKSSKIISWLVSLGCSLFATPTSRGYSKGNTPKFLPE